MHDVQDHTAGRRAALRGRVDADGLFCGSSILFTVNIDPKKGRIRKYCICINLYIVCCVELWFREFMDEHEHGFKDMMVVVMNTVTPHAASTHLL